jgi:hypothetical protein
MVFMYVICTTIYNALNQTSLSSEFQTATNLLQLSRLPVRASSRQPACLLIGCGQNVGTVGVGTLPIGGMVANIKAGLELQSKVGTTGRPYSPTSNFTS